MGSGIQGVRVEGICSEAEEVREADRTEDVLPELLGRIEGICDAAASDGDPTFLTIDEAQKLTPIIYNEGPTVERPLHIPTWDAYRFAELIANTPNFLTRKTVSDELGLFYRGLAESSQIYRGSDESSEYPSYTVNDYVFQKIEGPNYRGVLTFAINGVSFKLDQDSKRGGQGLSA